MKLNIDEFGKWCDAFGPSGFERDVAILVKEYTEPFADEVLQDRTGSIIFKKGNKGPKIMLAGHIDEVGFMVSGISDDGFLTFNQLGGWWDQVLLSQRVVIKIRDGTKIKGIICSKPPHILSAEDRSKVVTKDKMFIDVGCKTKKGVKALGITLGDPIIPDAAFEIIKRKQFKKDNETGKYNEKEVTLAVGKAFDDRLGAFIISEVLRKIKEENIELPNQIYGAATVQEEVGLRGARTSAQMIQPDVGIALEVDISGDVPGVDKTTMAASMSNGPSILVADGSMLPNPNLKHFVIDVAKEMGMDIQLSIIARGGTDAGVMHITGSGCPSIVLGIPTRHIHSHYGILDVEDLEKCVDLLIEILKRLDQKTIDSFTKI
ncbi:MAG: M42 family metallopeptidase [Candidatus Heimdallarchaeota archaeon]|nr:M42 family metallopeptidase [Candidatus Heimdallarchaeota archaeon]MBY8994906.1 M42 family metallopeptidase [Candidatus Heimdallarchaeota archaeon]